MNDLQSRWDIHVELEDLNAEAARLAAIIKKNFEEVGVWVGCGTNGLLEI